MNPLNPLEKLLIGLLFVLGVYGAGYYHGDRSGSNAVQVKWDKAESARKQAEADAIRLNDHANQMAQERNDEINRQVADSMEQRTATLRRDSAAARAAVDAAGGLRDPGAVRHCPDPAAQTAGNGRHDETGPGDGQLSKEAEDFLFSEAERADELAEQLREAQEWIRANGFYGTPLP